MKNPLDRRPSVGCHGREGAILRRARETPRFLQRSAPNGVEWGAVLTGVNRALLLCLSSFALRACLFVFCFLSSAFCLLPFAGSVRRHR